MKRMLSLLLAVVLVLMLSACNRKPQLNQEDTTAPDTQPIAPTDNGDGVAQVGDMLAQPEKVVSLGELGELTVSLQTQSSYAVARSITYALRVQGERVTFYERNTETDFLAEEFYGYESLCVADGDAVSHYTNSKISGTDFAATDLSGEYGTEDGYFRNQLAALGIDYQDWFLTDGFVKCEDARVIGVDCYVYTTAFTDIFGEGYKAKIYVDKITGLWVRVEREIPGTEDVFTAQVQTVEQSAAVIPGAQYTTIPPQYSYAVEGIHVTATALDFSNPDHAVLYLKTTNTRETDVQLSSHYVLVNGLCVGGNMMKHICPAGETVITGVELPNAVLDRSAIDSIQDIRFAFWIEEIHMEEDTPVSDGILVENTGELTVQTDTPAEPLPDAGGKGHLLLEGSDLLLRLESLATQPNGTAWLNMYCENGWAEPVQVAVSLVSLNGMPCTCSGRISMQEGQKGYGGFAIPRSVLLELGVDSVEWVELTYQVFLGDNVMSTECIVEQSELMKLELNPVEVQG